MLKNTLKLSVIGGVVLLLGLGGCGGGNPFKKGGSNNSNRPPVAQAGPDQTVVLGNTIVLTSTSTDPDGDPLTYEWTDITNNNIIGTSSTLTMSSSELGLGVRNIKLKVTDSKGSSSTDTLQLNISSNVSSTTTIDTTPPVFMTSDILSTPSGQINIANIVATDVNRVTYTLGGVDSSYFTLDANTGTLSFRNAPAYTVRRTYAITIDATDTQGNKTSKNFTINVSNIVRQSDVLKTGQVNCYDPDTNVKIPCNNLKAKGQDGYYQAGRVLDYTPLSSSTGNNVIRDDNNYRTLNLEWQNEANMSSARDMNWSEANATCSRLVLDGGGWRLPSIDELERIVDYGKFNTNNIDPVFRIKLNGIYWSSSDYNLSYGNAWVFDFRYAKSYPLNKSSNRLVRCVR